MRSVYSIIYFLLIAALAVCGVLAHKSSRPTRNAVSFLEAALIPPVLGNLLIVGTDIRITSLIGCYLYYIGMDLVMYSLVNFTNQYSKGIGGGKGEHKPTVMYLLLAADAVQLMLNPFTGHAFSIKEIEVDGAAYFKMIPHWGQTLHRVVDYGVLICVLLIFILASVKTPKITRERYTVLLLTMVAVALLLSYNIFFRYAIDRSMIGFGVFGIMIFYFAILYRPLRLLDKVLSNIVSNLSDSFYVFDPNGNCIWANEQGCKLVGITDGDYEEMTIKLMDLFGDPSKTDTNKTKMKIGDGSEARFYILEENRVNDSMGRLNGTYLRIQDVTEGEQQLQQRDEQIGQISQEAYRDPLTGVGSKNAYNKKVSELNAQLAEGEDIQFAVVMIDMNNLKGINDDYGHKAGDIYIKGCCQLICETFKHSPVYRIGGDEFVAILQGRDYANRVQAKDVLRFAYSESSADVEAEPWMRYSAAVGMAEYASDDCTYELVFKRADEDMYNDKKSFKEKHGSYR